MNDIYSLLKELLLYSQFLTPDEFAEVRKEASRTADFKGNKAARVLFENTMDHIVAMVD